MNDRLMLAVMVTNGLLSSGRLSSLTTNRIAADALLMADALLAAAGEQDDPALHEDCVGVDVHNVVVGRIQDERDRAIARAEAAEAKVAEVEAKFKELRSDYNEVVAANSEWESSAADLEAKVARLERQLEPLTEDEAEAAFSEWDGVGTEYLGMMRRDIAIMAVKARRSE